MHTKRWDVVVMMGAGAVLWVLGALFLWQDLAVPPEAFLGIGAIGAAALSIARLPQGLRWVGPWSLLTCIVGAGLWFRATTSPLLIIPLGVTLAATVVALKRTSVEEKHHRLVLWYSLTLSVLATSVAVYFHVFTLGVMEHEVGRRLLLTFLWLLFGLVMVVRSLRKQDTYGRDAGFLALAFALGKVLLYDTTHLGGPLRITLLLGAGSLFFVGALLAGRFPGAPAPTPALRPEA
jgi:hypothetical protein